VKEHILFIFLVVAAIGATWYIRGEVAKKDLQNRILTAPSKHHTKTDVEKVKQPNRSAEVNNTKPTSEEHQIDADSVFTAGMKKGMDSARAMFIYYTAPIDTTVRFDSIGSVHVWYNPLQRRGLIEWKSEPLQIITVTNTDSIFIKIPEEREWWKTPVYVVGSFAVGWLAHDILKE